MGIIIPPCKTIGSHRGSLSEYIQSLSANADNITEDDEPSQPLARRIFRRIAALLTHNCHR